MPDAPTRQNAGEHRDLAGGDGSRDLLVVERDQIGPGPTAADDGDHVDGQSLAGGDRSGDVCTVGGAEGGARVVDEYAVAAECCGGCDGGVSVEDESVGGVGDFDVCSGAEVCFGVKDAEACGDDGAVDGL